MPTVYIYSASTYIYRAVAAVAARAGSSSATESFSRLASCARGRGSIRECIYATAPAASAALSSASRDVELGTQALALP